MGIGPKVGRDRLRWWLSNSTVKERAQRTAHTAHRTPTTGIHLLIVRFIGRRGFVWKLTKHTHLCYGLHVALVRVYISYFCIVCRCAVPRGNIYRLPSARSVKRSVHDIECRRRRPSSSWSFVRAAIRCHGSTNPTNKEWKTMITNEKLCVVDVSQSIAFRPIQHELFASIRLLPFHIRSTPIPLIDVRVRSTPWKIVYRTIFYVIESVLDEATWLTRYTY